MSEWNEYVFYDLLGRARKIWTDGSPEWLVPQAVRGLLDSPLGMEETTLDVEMINHRAFEAFEIEVFEEKTNKSVDRTVVYLEDGPCPICSSSERQSICVNCYKRRGCFETNMCCTCWKILAEATAGEDGV